MRPGCRSAGCVTCTRGHNLSLTGGRRAGAAVQAFSNSSLLGQAGQTNTVRRPQDCLAERTAARCRLMCFHVDGCEPAARVSVLSQHRPESGTLFFGVGP